MTCTFRRVTELSSEKRWNCIKSGLNLKANKLTKNSTLWKSWTFVVDNLRTDIETWWHILKVMKGALPGCSQDVRFHPDRGSEVVPSVIGSNLNFGEFTLGVDLVLDFTPNTLIEGTKNVQNGVANVRFRWIHPLCFNIIHSSFDPALGWCPRWQI